MTNVTWPSRRFSEWGHADFQVLLVEQPSKWNELRKIDHKQRLENGEKPFGPDLSGLELDCKPDGYQNIDLSHAVWKSGSLSHCNLTGANLKGARLGSIDGDGEDNNGRNTSLLDVTGTNFCNADLTGADLRGCSGLNARKLAGANLLDCKLPEGLSFSEESIAIDLAKSAKTLQYILITTCFLCAVSMLSLNDTAFVAQSASLKLPILGIQVGVAEFFKFSPIIILAQFVYLQLHLQNLWQSLASLPIIFPDGARLNHRIYPSLIVEVSSFMIPRLRKGGTLFSFLEKAIVVFSVWLIAPLTIILFYRFDLIIRDRANHLLLLLIVGALVLTLLIFCTSMKWLFSVEHLWQDKETPHMGRVAAESFFLNMSLTCVIMIPIVCFSGYIYSYDRDHWRDFDANLDGAILSKRPNSWRPADGYDTVQGITRPRIRLNNARGESIFLAGSNLSSGRFEKVAFKKVDFSHSEMNQAHFFDVDLDDVNFQNATMEGAEFINGKLLNAHFAYANMNKVKMLGVRFENTDFHDLEALEIRVEANVKESRFIDCYFNNDKAVFSGSNFGSTEFLDLDISWAKFEKPSQAVP
ncbi:MAG: pentapeptide repeat-containing protein [Acidobacteriota bacterium]|nr:pentapeptide repeat-containing protein [Acidobacteriota bacterium]